MFGWARGRSAARRGSAMTLGLTAAIAILLTLPQTPAVAAPANPSDDSLSAARSAQDAAAAEVGRISALVAVAETDLQRAGLVVEAANDAYREAEGRLDEATAAAAAAADELRVAQAAVSTAQADVATLGRESYMRSDSINSLAALVSADGPTELLDRAATLRLLGDQRTATLEGLRVAEARQADADAMARATVTEHQAAAAEAEESKTEAEAQMAVFQSAMQTASAQMSAYQQQLQEAEVALLALQGQRNAYQAWQDEQSRQRAAEQARAAAATQAAAEAAARARQAPAPASSSSTPANGVRTPVVIGSGVAPTSGQFSTCFETRWGVMHKGLDIAAPIGTPIYAPVAGRVIRAGSATGYGLAVYIQHDDGSVSVYGHIDGFFVTAGERVSAGQLIAQVGNRGQSTGPHLHFQVNTDGLHAGAINPVTWLAQYGVSMGGRCR